MLKAVRFVLVALTALLAVPAATVHAAPRMPIGFFDDPSFRWSPTRDQNLQLAAVHRRVRHPHDRDLGRRSRRRGRRIAANGDDPAYQLTDLDDLVFQSSAVQPARDDQHHRHAEVGERRQGAERDAEEAGRPDHVREDARHALQRAHRPRVRLPLVGLERAEPAAVPDAAVRRQEDRRAGELREALQGCVRRHQVGQPVGEGRDRRDVGPRPRQAAQGRSARASRPGRSRGCSRR